jgi:GMP synthase-like glutamine amidotransferase
MSVRHRHHPVFGVQFHPESGGTFSGRALVAAFLDISSRSVVTGSPGRAPLGGHP